MKSTFLILLYEMGFLRNTSSTSHIITIEKKNVELVTFLSNFSAMCKHAPSLLDFGCVLFHVTKSLVMPSRLKVLQDRQPNPKVELCWGLVWERMNGGHFGSGERVYLSGEGQPGMADQAWDGIVGDRTHYVLTPGPRLLSPTWVSRLCTN